MARISIITPVYNGASYIAACVENVRSQQVDDLEHIVVDGGSTDGTVSVLTGLAARYRNLRFISEKDDSQSVAMNKGIRIATSDIIGILNADDFYEPGAIVEGLRFLESHPGIDFVAGDCRILRSGEPPVINRPSDLRLESLLLGWDWAEYPCNPSAYFYRKRVHDEVGYYDTTDHYAMDLVFILECATKVKMAYVPRLWGNFRLLPHTKTFKDANNAPTRVREIKNRWLSQLSLVQRLKMSLIWQQKRISRKLIGR